MAKIEDVLNDLVTIKQESSDYIAARDKIDADLTAQIADLTAKLAAGVADAATVQAGIDAAFVAAEDAKAALAPPGAPAPAA